MSRGNLKLLVLFFAILVSILSLGLVLFAKNQPEPPPPPQGILQAAHSEKYLVKEYQGMVAVFYSQQQNTPKYITDVSVKALPLADRQHLQQGIYVANDRALTSLLEDYQ